MQCGVCCGDDFVNQNPDQGMGICRGEAKVGEGGEVGDQIGMLKII